MSAVPATGAPVCLPPRSTMGRAPQPLPEHSIDCHFHVIDPSAPLITPRSYTPRPASLADWRRMADAIGVERGVLVQPSVYGFDNSVLLNALATDTERLRGVVVIPPKTPTDQLSAMHAQGVRGVRVNLRNLGGLPLSDVPGLAEKIAPLGWHLQFQVGPGQFDTLRQLAPELPVPGVIDHAGFAPVDDAVMIANALVQLQGLLDAGNVFVKLSAPYRLENQPAYPGFAALARGLVRSHPDRILWGSDWPHTELFDQVPDDLDLIAEAFSWMNSDTVRQRICVANPDGLYWRN